MEKQNDEDLVEIVDSGAVSIKTLNGECVEISYHLKAEPKDGEEGVCTFSEDKLSSCDLAQNVNDKSDNDFDKNAAVGNVNRDFVEDLHADGVHVSQGKDGVERENDFKKPRGFEYGTECIAFDPDNPKTPIVIRDGFTYQGEEIESHIARISELLSRQTYVISESIPEPKTYDNNGDRIIFGLEQTESGYKQVCVRDSRYQDYLGDLDENDTVDCLDANGLLGKQNEDAIEALCSESEITISQDKCGDHCVCKTMADMVHLNLDVPGMVAIGDGLDIIGLMEKQNVEADNVDSDVLCIKVADSEAVCIKSQDSEGVEIAYNLKKTKDGDEFVYTFSENEVGLDSESTALYHDLDHGFDKCVLGEQNEEPDEIASSEVHH